MAADFELSSRCEGKSPRVPQAVPTSLESCESILNSSSRFARNWLNTRAVSTFPRSFAPPLGSFLNLELRIDRRTAHHRRNGLGTRGGFEFSQSRSIPNKISNVVNDAQTQRITARDSRNHRTGRLRSNRQSKIPMSRSQIIRQNLVRFSVPFATGHERASFTEYGEGGEGVD